MSLKLCLLIQDYCSDKNMKQILDDLMHTHENKQQKNMSWSSAPRLALYTHTHGYIYIYICSSSRSSVYNIETAFGLYSSSDKSHLLSQKGSRRG